MYKREVVITGFGLKTPLGKDSEENWENLRAMKTGITYHPRDDWPNFLQYFGKV